MISYYFFHKDDVFLHLNINSLTFQIEKQQLLDQGFERIGDKVKAENSQIAHEKFNLMLQNELSNIYSGANNLLRFTTGIKSKIKTNKSIKS